MDEKHRDKLRSYRVRLTNDLDGALVATHLKNEGVLSQTDLDTVSAEPSKLKQSEKLLDILPRRGPKAFNSFIQVLENLHFPHSFLLESRSVDGEMVNQSEAESSSSEVNNKGVTMDEGFDEVPEGGYDRTDAPSAGEDCTDMRPTGDADSNLSEPDGRFGIGSSKISKAANPGMPLPQEFPTPSAGPITPSQLEAGSFYPMSRVPRGLCVLVNNKNFLPASGMENYPRNGTDIDAEAFVQLFRELGYIVQDHKNMSCYEMRKIFKQASALDFSRYSALCCCILSHGQEGVVYGTDGTIDIKELTGYFRGSNLAGKPKMFFFQACQGSEYMDAVEPDRGRMEVDGPADYGNDISLPTESDFIYAYSTVPGYYSWRNSAKGSWFIQAIIEVFRKYAHKMDVVRMLTRVNGIVATKKSQTGQRASHHKRQISSIVTQLRKELYLFPPHGPLRQIEVEW